ncbi:MAG TPA: prepilin peptidase [Alphaproteobacteria bacterium]|nr:prepilin peptidase [Alphaproteobacteria bacterium]USO05766.1 MAG: prepilin peptidase [Rhodospirillales bacterium]HOO81440.1 prepilin peptidase [Alphaproteobacteria bacterium]
MLLLIVFLMCLFVVIGTGGLSALSDLRGMTIPNLHSLIVLGAFVFCYGALWFGGRDDVFASLASHIVAALIVFLITLAMFMGKLMGAGDSKLASALALWAGLKGLVPFIFYMSVAGGVLALAALALKKWAPVKAPKPESWVAQVQGGASKVPYGVAIVLGALASFVKIGYFDLDVLSSFVVE